MTNLVGILIILVMVIGAQAKSAIIKADAGQPTSEDPAIGEVANAKFAADQVERDVLALSHKIEEEQEVAELRRIERGQADLMVVAAQKTLEQRRALLAEADREDYDRRSGLLALRNEIEDLKRKRSAIDTSAPPVAVLEHLPTPMVKTVFGQEAHFRLQHGRITRLPWDELVARLKAEAASKVWKLRDSDSISETIGPVDGFRMKYTLKKVEYVLESKGGPTRQAGVELDQFLLLPMTEDLGEPLATAIGKDSDFRSTLKTLDPNKTTITVWVYPDSFHQFRDLKQHLFKLGYLTASRPMPEGQPIGGSPTGSKSVSQ